MEFISAEEFLKQPKEVQKVFLDWWKPSVGDLYSENTKYGYELKMIEYSIVSAIKNNLDKMELFKIIVVPNLVEGQLRQFIEDKTNHKISISPSLEGKYYVGYDKYANNEDGDLKRLVYVDNILIGLWKVALEIAKEKVKA